MAVERVIGIDFGTSTSVIRVKRYENGKAIGENLETKEVIFGGIGSTVPTLIQKKDDDEDIVYYGYEAQQKRKKTTTYHSFKVDLESSDPDKRTKARALTEEFFCYLAKVYKAQSEGGHLGNPDDKERTVVSYPVKWSEETRKFMLEAARKAGFPNVTGTDEAQAAIQAVTVMSEDHLRKNGLLVNGTPSNILLIDMGAGTTDLVLCQYTPGENAKAEILSTWPKDGEILFGGKEVDSLLQGFFRDMLDEEDAQLVFKRVGVDKFKSWKEETVSPALHKGDSVSDFDALDTCIEMADIEMNDYCLDRAAFENCLADYLKQLPELINGCIESSSIKGNDVDLIIVTGGHSQWYFVKEMLTGKMPGFGEITLERIQEDPSRVIPITRPQETVALGLVYSDVASVSVPGPQSKNTKQVSQEISAFPELSVDDGYGPTLQSVRLAEVEFEETDTYSTSNAIRRVIKQMPEIKNRSDILFPQFPLDPGDAARLSKLKYNLDVPDLELVIIGRDSTLLGTANKGFVLSSRGIYSKGGNYGPRFIPWDKFAKSTITFEYPGLVLHEPALITNVWGAHGMSQFWEKLHQEMNKMI